VRSAFLVLYETLVRQIPLNAERTRDSVDSSTNSAIALRYHALRAGLTLVNLSPDNITLRHRAARGHASYVGHGQASLHSCRS
jgi:hypothetical protein